MKIAIKKKLCSFGAVGVGVAVDCSDGKMAIGEMDPIAGSLSSHLVVLFEIHEG